MKNLFLFAALLWAGTTAQGASVKYRTTSDWGTGFNGEITIVNDSDTPLDGWQLTFDFDRSLSVIWDATIVSAADGKFVIAPVGWNSQIPARGSVTFGFGGAPGNLSAGPQNFVVNGTAVGGGGDGTPGYNPELFQFSAQASSQWQGGYTASVTIRNNNPDPLTGWTLSFRGSSKIQALWNGALSTDGDLNVVSGDATTARIGPQSSVTFGYSATGKLAAETFTECTFNGSPCSVVITVAPEGGVQDALALQLAGVEDTATQFSVVPGTSTFRLSLSDGKTVNTRVSSNNPLVATVRMVDSDILEVTALAPGRAGLRLEQAGGTVTRYIGLRVLNEDGTAPGMPSYLSLGSVSEDTADHLNFWQAFGDGAKNRRVDIRYIYLNGGPFFGWNTWSNTDGGRVTSYIRQSRMLGMIPFFVWYNIPEGSEGYEIDLQHAQSPIYMKAYFENLKLALDLINKESPDDLVGLVLEPDFIGYLAQNAKAEASQIPAAVDAAYQAGVLDAKTDPTFEPTVRGLIQAINYVIQKHSPQAYFGWQLNLWASPPGGFTTPVPGKGIIQKTQDVGIDAGRKAIYNEASAITNYYLRAGITSNGAKFLSIDKYGLDAVGYQASAATDPASSFWFWNNDYWGNYLIFAKAMKDTAKLPVILWQIPVGRINSTQQANPYNTSGVFADLANRSREYEDSAPDFFFGDTFRTTGRRLAWFSTNLAGDPGVVANGDTVTWREHMTDTAAAGVISILFGPGVGDSTSNVGSPPPDAYWWIVKAQHYFAAPVKLQ